jgi:hypothetical protein
VRTPPLPLVALRKHTCISNTASLHKDLALPTALRPFTWKSLSLSLALSLSISLPLSHSLSPLPFSPHFTRLKRAYLHVMCMHPSICCTKILHFWQRCSFSSRSACAASRSSRGSLSSSGRAWKASQLIPGCHATRHRPQSASSQPSCRTPISFVFCYSICRSFLAAKMCSSSREGDRPREGI